MKKASVLISIAILLCLLSALALLPGRNDDVLDAVSISGLLPSPSPSLMPSPSPVITPSPTVQPSPSPSPSPSPQPEYYVVSMVGDCTVASSQHHKGTAYAFESIVGDSYSYPFAETIGYFEDDYLSLANMEGVFTKNSRSSGATFVFKSDPEYAKVFSQGGIDMVTLANNHSLDFGAQGLEDTRAALDAEGVRYVCDDGWYIYQKDDGIKIGVYAKLYPTVQNVEKGIAELKEAGAEVIIAALHWGIEGSYQVTADQQAVGHAAIDAGALIVYGCHPHVLQKTEEYNGGYIFNSLGNWSFGGNTNPRDRDTAIIRATLQRSANSEISVSSVEYIPCELSGSAGCNDYQPHPYEEGSEGFLRAMSKLDGTFTGPDLSIDYSAFHKNDSETAGTPDETPG